MSDYDHDAAFKRIGHRILAELAILPPAGATLPTCPRPNPAYADEIERLSPEQQEALGAANPFHPDCGYAEIASATD